MSDFNLWLKWRWMVLGNSTSQWVNANLLFGQEDESISGRCYRRAREGSAAWNVVRITVDWLMQWMHEGHCRYAYFNDIEICTSRKADHAVLMQTTTEPE
jgi:hypothetical protein